MNRNKKRSNPPIKDFVLSKRGEFAVSALKARNVADLAKFTEAHILSIPGIGASTLDEIRAIVRQCGHSFKKPRKA